MIYWKATVLLYHHSVRGYGALLKPVLLGDGNFTIFFCFLISSFCISLFGPPPLYLTSKSCYPSCGCLALEYTANNSWSYFNIINHAYQVFTMNLYPS